MERRVIKIVYSGQAEEIACKSGDGYNVFIKKILQRYGIPIQFQKYSQITNGFSLQFLEDPFDLYLELFPKPKTLFFLRLDFVGLVNCLGHISQHSVAKRLRKQNRITKRQMIRQTKAPKRAALGKFSISTQSRNRSSLFVYDDEFIFKKPAAPVRQFQRGTTEKGTTDKNAKDAFIFKKPALLGNLRKKISVSSQTHGMASSPQKGNDNGVFKKPAPVGIRSGSTKSKQYPHQGSKNAEGLVDCIGFLNKAFIFERTLSRD